MNGVSTLNDVQRFFRPDGIEVEKGIAITEDRVAQNRSLYEKYCNFFTAYPDCFIDLITPLDSNFKLFYYQRIFLRACLRYRIHYCVAPRAFSKSFISILAMILKCIFQPKSKCFIAAPGKEQGAKIAREKVEEILDKFPLLRKELVKDNYVSSGDYLRMTFKNGSVFDVVGALDSARGGRRHFGLVDEVRDHDADTVNEVILPLMNVNRRNGAGMVNPYEPHQARFFMTSAGLKGTYAYQELIESLEKEIIDPRSVFVWGCDYRVPMRAGLLDKNYINELKMSQTMKDDSFAREYLGKWTGGSADSWFDFDKMKKYRKLINPENSQKIKENSKAFYLLAVDVGRLSCQTVVTVFKVFPGESDFSCSLVNIFILGKTEETKHFTKQANDLKLIIEHFAPKEVVIDGNGLGVGLLDEMVTETFDDRVNRRLPAYCSVNNEDYRQSLYPNAIPLIYVIKANNTLDSKIHGNCYSKVFSGKVSFLVPEQEIKGRLLASKVGQKMKIEKRMERVLPHELTTRLLEEMANLKLRPGAGLEIKLERINSKMGKDKFSSFEYGLWRMKEIEEDWYKKIRKRSRNRNLAFFN